VPSATLAPPTRTDETRSVAAPTRGAARWGSLDVLRGVALVAMVAQHLADWTGGRVRERFVGFEAFLVTDLAAPIFALGAGAAAYLVGQRIRPSASMRRRSDGDAAPIDRRRARRAAWRWGQVLLLGLAIDVAVGGGVDGGGVLPSLAVLGTMVTAASALGLTSAAGWWALAAGGAALALPAKALGGDGFVHELVAGPFSIVVYGTFAAAGAALAARNRGAGEQALPLVPAAIAALVAGTAAAGLVPAMAPEGVWPPARHPGDLAFTMWGLAASLAVWALVRAHVPVDSRVGAGLARAGQRTLLVFGGHYLVKLALQHSGHLGTLDTWRWGLVTWLAIALAVALAVAPRPGWSRSVQRAKAASSTSM
jgi:hypothetical protein